MEVNFAKLKEAGVRLAPVARPGVPPNAATVVADASIVDNSKPASIVDAVSELVGRMPPGWELTDIHFKGRRLEFEYQPALERLLVERTREANTARNRADEAVAAADRAEKTARRLFDDLLRCGDPDKREFCNVAGIDVADVNVEV